MKKIVVKGARMHNLKNIDVEIPRDKLVVEYKQIDYGVTAATQSNKFTDINQSDWFYDYVLAAKSYGYIEGYNDDTFRPNNCVNRVEAMKIAVNALMPGAEVSSSAPLFYDDKAIVDMSATTWYSPYARALFLDRLVGTVHTQSVKNLENNLVSQINFFPADPMSRKEVAYMMHQIDKHLEYNKPILPPEPKEGWYDWSEYNVSFEVPEGYYVQKIENNDNKLIIGKDLDITDVYDSGDSGLSSLTFKKDTAYQKYTYESVIGNYADVGILYTDVATRGFYEIKGVNDYLLEVPGGVLIYHMGYDDAKSYLRNRVLSSLIVPNSELKLVSGFPEQTDYYNFGNGHYNETLTLHDNNDILSIEMTYPGGCHEHEFQLLWKGEADNADNDNNVYLVDLYLEHNDNEEYCDFNSDDRFDFDISAIKEELEGKVMLRVHGGANGTQYIDYVI